MSSHCTTSIHGLNNYAKPSIARETLRLEVLRDALGSDSTSDAISSKELELDKEIIQLIQNACKNDKLPRVLELAKMLHHAPSFDMATKVAGFYHLIGLQEKIEILKQDRENGDDDPRETARKQRSQWKRDSAAVPPPRELNSTGYQPVAKPFQDFGPPPIVHRPGLARAAVASSSKTPVYDDWDIEGNDSISTDLGLEGKRKRDQSEQPTRDSMSPGLDGGPKRRALAAPTKPSKFSYKIKP